MCVQSLPAGWSLVAFAEDQAHICPNGFSKHDVITDPKAQAGACDCACVVDAGATCMSGTIQTLNSQGSGCGGVGPTLSAANSACQVYSNKLDNHFAAKPPSAPATCTASSKANVDKVTSGAARLCDIPTACEEDVCKGVIESGFDACISQDGDVMCPSGWSMKRTLVGDSPSLSCSDCDSCSGTATCTEGVLDFFSDDNCQNNVASESVDNKCQPSMSHPLYKSYKYTAQTVSTQCTGDGPKTATVGLNVPRTICCK
jgi:hypothetical protein